jgi:hypothetical protein
MAHGLRPNAAFLVTAVVLALVAGATATSGCYDTTTHKCDCAGTEAACQGTWSAQCKCGAVASSKVNMTQPWCTPTEDQSSRFACKPFPASYTAVSGATLEMVINTGHDVKLMADKAAYDACTMTSATNLNTMVAKGTVSTG